MLAPDGALKVLRFMRSPASLLSTKNQRIDYMSSAVQQAPAMLRLNANDNILVATRVVEKGESQDGVTTTARIMRGHKMANRRIAKGEPIRKFGQIIGFAKNDIVPGDWVHEHNVEMGELSHDYAFAQAARNEFLLPEAERATFQGYRRKNGKVGT